MNCPSCRFDNPAGMRFCGQCGTKLEARCPQCDAVAPPGFKFCGECGAPLGAGSPAAPAAPQPTAEAPATEAPPTAATEPETPAAPVPTAVPEAPAIDQAEHKQVTVLACRLADSESLSTSLGAEAMHDLLSRFSAAARAEVERYGGTVNQFRAQGFFASFGAPIAHEDHTRRALLTTFALAQRLREPSGTDEPPLTIAVGLDTGSVVVGGVGDMIVGQTVDHAEHLRDVAEAGEVLVSEAFGQVLAPLANVEPAPERGPSIARVVRWRGAYADGNLLDAANLSPFLGREREVGVLEELRAHAERGEGQIVGVAGEAGAGKSRLLHEFRRGLRGRPAVYLLGHCLSYGGDVPYFPLLTLIRRASSIAEDDPPEAVVEKLRASLARVGSDAERDLPYFLRLLGIEQGTESLDDLEALALQAKTFEAMRRMVLHASERALVVMEIEDLHWIDETSEAFLASLVEVIGAARVILLTSYRAGYQPPWMDRSYATQIALRRLSEDNSQAIVRALLERADLPSDLGEAIIAKAEGNPFFLEELARALMAAGDDAEAQLPDTVQGLISARIDRLPEIHKRLLQTASVLGRRFSRDLLVAVWEGSSEVIDSTLEDLKRREFVYEAPGDERACFFKHALTQEVTYQSLLERRRKALHLQAARALEELFADHLEDALDRLVYHYPRAGEADKTVSYLQQFANSAAGNYAHAEAARALESAIDHAQALDEDPDRRVAELVIQLAESFLPLARFPQTLELLERHRERFEQLDDPALLGPFSFWLAHTHSYLGNQENAVACAEQAIELARSAGDETTEGKAHYVLGRDGFWAGRFEAGAAASLAAVVLLERAGEPWWQGQAYWVAAFNEYMTGDFPKSLDAFGRAHSIGENLGDYRLDTSWSSGFVYASLGEAEAGIEKCRSGREAARDPLNQAAAQGFLGYAYLENGDLETAIATLEDAVARMEKTGMQQLLGWFSTYLGEAYILAERPEDARAAIERARVVTTEASFLYGRALAERAEGRLALSCGDFDAARQALEASREAFESLQIPFEIARTDLDRARLALAVHDDPAAHLDAATEVFERLHVPRYRERAEALRADL